MSCNMMEYKELLNAYVEEIVKRSELESLVKKLRSAQIAEKYSRIFSEMSDSNRQAWEIANNTKLMYETEIDKMINTFEEDK